MKRVRYGTWILGAIVLFFVLALGFRLLPITSPGPIITSDATSTADQLPINPGLTPQDGVVIEHTDGSATLTRGPTTVPAQARMKVQTGDVLTAGGAELSVIVPHYGRILLDARTTVTFIEAFESTNRERLRIRLSVENGQVWTRLVKPIGPDSVFSVQADGADALTLFASFGASVNGADVRYEVSNGQIAVSRVAARTPTYQDRANGIDDAVIYDPVGSAITVNKGERVSVPSGDAALTTEAFGVSDRSDAFVQAGNAEITAPALDLTSDPTLDIQTSTSTSSS